MYTVEPIRDLDILDRCFEIAREHDRHRSSGSVSWEMIILIGLTTSLRISDLQRLKVKDILDKPYCEIKAKKTGKKAKIAINPSARKQLNRLLKTMDPDDYLIQSRQKDGVYHARRSISRQRAWQIMNIIAKRAGIDDHIGCHTLRKTFGYHFYRETQDIATLQRILGHTSRRDTLVYIGIIQDDIDEKVMNFNILPGRRR